ncbi:MAG: beta-galactosidase, partial [Bacteroidaceae bacterium]|nr:beta-galactosidase [Bacteroidaceae bacterium]
MKRILTCSLLACAVSVMAQRAINFNADWQMRGKTVTLPRAWNEGEAFRVPIANLPDDTVRYVKTFAAPKSWKGKKVFIEFEGARQAAEVWLNGKHLGLHENGVMAFGFDLTPYL